MCTGGDVLAKVVFLLLFFLFCSNVSIFNQYGIKIFRAMGMRYDMHFISHCRYGWRANKKFNKKKKSYFWIRKNNGNYKAITMDFRTQNNECARNETCIWIGGLLCTKHHRSSWNIKSSLPIPADKPEREAPFINQPNFRLKRILNRVFVRKNGKYYANVGGGLGTDKL